MRCPWRVLLSEDHRIFMRRPCKAPASSGDNSGEERVAPGTRPPSDPLGNRLRSLRPIGGHDAAGQRPADRLKLHKGSKSFSFFLSQKTTVSRDTSKTPKQAPLFLPKPVSKPISQSTSQNVVGKVS